jgi:hypothetical protein
VKGCEERRREWNSLLAQRPAASDGMAAVAWRPVVRGTIVGLATIVTLTF